MPETVDAVRAELGAFVTAHQRLVEAVRGLLADLAPLVRAYPDSDLTVALGRFTAALDDASADIEPEASMATPPRVHHPWDAQCSGHLPGAPASADVVCPVCRPEDWIAAEAAQPKGQYGRCPVVDNGGDAHFRPHECKMPLDKDGYCSWHGKVR